MLKDREWVHPPVKLKLNAKQKKELFGVKAFPSQKEQLGRKGRNFLEKGPNPKVSLIKGKIPKLRFQRKKLTSKFPNNPNPNKNAKGEEIKFLGART